MELPVRVVCGGCLRSVDLAPDLFGKSPTVCPVCGVSLDSAAGLRETPSSGDLGPGLDGDPSSMGSGVETRDVDPACDVWTRGSLGMIDRFHLRERLGTGGFGVVYKAYDPRLDRDAALKVLKADRPDDRVKTRFFREARAVAALNHPNIVKVHDSGCDGRHYWVAYQLVEGITLTRMLAEGRRPDFVVTARIVRALADALRHAHRRNVFHRDLKPANVIIDPNGNPCLIDFGLARRADCDSDLTRDGVILGTPDYMPPEQKAGKSRAADARSDLYSLGLILYEMLTGKRAVEQAGSVPAWQKGDKEAAAIPPPRSIQKDVPIYLDQVCMKLLATDVAARYPGAKALCLDLERWIRTRKATREISPTLTSVVLGIGGALLLAVGLTAMSGLVLRTDASAVALPFAGGVVPAAIVPTPEERTDDSLPAATHWGSSAETPARPDDAPPLAGAALPPLSLAQEVWVFQKHDRYHTTRCVTVQRREQSAELMTLREALKSYSKILECANCQESRRHEGVVLPAAP